MTVNWVGWKFDSMADYWAEKMVAMRVDSSAG